ncbi:hypothetical protein [Streptomyces indiaensis]|uniref:ANTAR domain-containing protein n=1 Tax=Streptomyces indiaensis TaxID=284033 RepID=A0ABN3D437_9ACTN|nr:hypothetical protein [Streptomyces indiaensis]MCF1645481.1 hypothetical protein [Streptomyces indiaensis]
MTTTAEAAALARQRQSLAPVGTPQRKAAGVAALLLDEARTHAGARRLLDQHRIPTELRPLVLALLDELAEARPPEPAPDTPPAAP